MGYQALYRVWRPRRFADLVGQGHITRTLQNAIEQNKFSHAYLFSGPRGTGKTSAAKIFAQAINCEEAPTREPCLKCDACIGIMNGSISDVIEIDAASNTSVDHIREIRDKVKYATSSVPYKVYIIDEVHMISVNAFNALLKTLEEPPQHVVFILATTEPHKIPMTIISRCQRFDFKPIAQQAMIERMRHIVTEEGISVSDKALETIALTAEGGMRDALSILDQAISYSDEQVELEDVLAVTGGVSQSVLTDMASAMYEQDVKKALSLLDQMIQSGKDPTRFVYDFIYYLRDLLLYQADTSLETMLERAVVDTPFKELANTIPNDWIQNAIMRMNQCQQEIKWTNSPNVMIEIAILSITHRYHTNQQQSNSHSPAVSELSQKLLQLEQELKILKQSQSTTIPAPQQVRQPANRVSKTRYQIPFDRIRHILDEAEKSILKEVQSKWATFLNQLKATNAPAHATIQDSKPAAASEKGLVVAFRYEIHCALFMDHKQMVEAILAQVTGKSFDIIPIPIQEWTKLREEYVQQLSQVKAEKDPFVEEARKLFGDDLIKVYD